MNGGGRPENLPLLFCKSVQFVAGVASFSKVCIFIENESFHFGDRFQRLTFSKKMITYRCKVKTQRKVCGFDENDMKTYSCRQGLHGML